MLLLLDVSGMEKKRIRTMIEFTKVNNHKISYKPIVETFIIVIFLAVSKSWFNKVT